VHSVKRGAWRRNKGVLQKHRRKRREERGERREERRERKTEQRKDPAEGEKLVVTSWLKTERKPKTSDHLKSPVPRPYPARSDLARLIHSLRFSLCWEATLNLGLIQKHTYSLVSRRYIKQHISTSARYVRHVRIVRQGLHNRLARLNFPESNKCLARLLQRL
jgi:hypothetical protein